MKVIWNKQVVAESDDIIVIESNHYFFFDSIKKEYFNASETHFVCPWKGQASYHNLEVDGVVNKDVVWFYLDLKEFVKGFKDYVVFWKGVEIVEQ